MKVEQLLKDPVFHLNLLLWMAKEQPRENYRINPFFYSLGFKIIYIEKPFPFPEETRQAIVNSDLEISLKPEPELILGNNITKKALYFEAKANAFSAESSNNKQARAHLMACGHVFGEVLAPLKSCLLCYVVPHEGCQRMSVCLLDLSQELKNKRLHPGLFSTHGLKVEAEHLIYTWDASFKTHVGIAEDSTSIMAEIDEDIDPSPLILLFSDEDCYNTDNRNFYRRVVLDQARACLFCDLHALPLEKPYETSPEQILLKVSDGIFQYLSRKRQKNIAKLIHERMFSKIFKHWKDKQPGVQLNGERLSLCWNHHQEKEEFLDWLEERSTKFDANK